MAATVTTSERYTVISADGHAGADIADYKPYLASRWHDEFDAWAADYVNPFADLLQPTAYRNWDSERRLAETESDGIAAEVLFPNTVPPFFEQGNLVAPAAHARGLRAALGRSAGAQPLAGRLLRRRARAAGRHRAGLRQRHRRRRGRGALGGQETFDSPSAASCCRPSRPTRTCRRCGRTTTSRCGRCAPTSTCRSTSTAAARCPTTASTRRPGP